MYGEQEMYYQLLDKDTSTITLTWKVIHISCMVVASISGFISAYCLGKSIEAFGDNCILNAKIRFRGDNQTVATVFNQPIPPIDINPIDLANTEWVTMSNCYFCQFTPLVFMIYGILWMILFIICSRGGAGFITDMVYRPWRIVYPAMFFSAVATVVTLVSSLQLDNGVKAFCGEFESVFNTTKCTTDIDKYTFLFSTQEKPFISNLQLSVYSSYACFMGWLVELVVLILRVACIADFQLIQITVTPKEEELIDVINPDDDDYSSRCSTDISSISRESIGGKGTSFFFPRRRRAPQSFRTAVNKVLSEEIQRTGSTGFITSVSDDFLGMNVSNYSLDEEIGRKAEEENASDLDFSKKSESFITSESSGSGTVPSFTQEDEIQRKGTKLSLDSKKEGTEASSKSSLFEEDSRIDRSFTQEDEIPEIRRTGTKLSLGNKKEGIQASSKSSSLFEEDSRKTGRDIQLDEDDDDVESKKKADGVYSDRNLSKSKDWSDTVSRPSTSKDIKSTDSKIKRRKVTYAESNQDIEDNEPKVTFSLPINEEEDVEEEISITKPSDLDDTHMPQDSASAHPIAQSNQQVASNEAQVTSSLPVHKVHAAAQTLPSKIIEKLSKEQKPPH